MNVQLERIVFDHGAGAPADRGLSLVTSGGPAPPWSPTETSPSLVAYPLKSDVPRPLRVEATFSFPAGFVAGVSVRAQPVSDEDVLGSTNAVVLPQPAAGSGRSSVMCGLTNTRMWELGIGRYGLMWQWQYRLPGSSAWLDLRVTKHIVYVTLAAPTKPWSENAPLRSDVLDLACRWASGITFVSSPATARKALRRIEAALFAFGDRLATPVTYLEAGDSRYTRSPAMAFALTDFLSLLAGQPPGGDNNVNCSDCASALATFANALGCGLQQVKIAKRNDGMMRTNPIVTVGAGRRPGYEPERVSRTRLFRFHEVTALDDPAEPPSGDAVFDACLMVDRDSNPTSQAVTHSFGLAAGMPAGSVSAPSTSVKYLRRLLSPAARNGSQVYPVNFRAIDGHGLNPGDVDEPTTRLHRFYVKEITEHAGPVAGAPQIGEKPPVLNGFRLFDRITNPANFAPGELFVRSVEYFYVAVYDVPTRKASDRRLRVSFAFARDVESAREALSWLLAQSTADFSVVPRDDSKFGDVAFSAVRQSTVYLAWGPVVIRVASIGKVPARVETIARDLVRAIQTPPAPRAQTTKQTTRGTRKI